MDGVVEQLVTRRQLEELALAAPVGMAILDQRLRYAFVNAELARMNGRSIGEHLGAQPRDVLPEMGRPLEQIARSVLATGQAVISRPVRGVPPSRPQGYWIGNYYPLCPDEHGRATRVGAIVIDVTGRVRATDRSDARYAITRALADPEAVGAAITDVLKAVCTGAGFPLAVTWKLDEKTSELALGETWPIDTPLAVQLREASQKVRFKPGDGMLGTVFETGRPMWSTRVQSDVRIKRRRLLASLGVATAFWFPIRSGKAVLGVIECLSDRGQEPDPDLLEMLGGAGVQIGGFLERVGTQARLGQSEQQRRELLQDMLRTAERERSLIANELHDDTIQIMSATLVTLDTLHDKARRSGDHTVAEAVARSRKILAEATERTRQLMFSLRPPLLEASGLEAAVRALLSELGDTRGFRWHLDAASDRYRWELEELFYRGVREAVVNAAKHAQASDLWVEIQPHGDTLCAVIRDNGSGFDPAHAFNRERRRRHLGFDVIAERFRLAAGDLAVQSEPGRGTTITMRAPLDVEDST